jgi:NAD(P)-dependent dehydrogenase (short-subunit alcohol dehydrogenase family)
MPTYADLKGKVILLTGGGNGIGKETVRAFSNQGATVFFCDRDEKAGAAVARSLPNTEFARVDLRKEHEVVRWITTASKETGNIDVLVNNAAIDPRIPLEELTGDRLEELFQINLKALFITTRECVPRMRSGSAIVNFSSITFHTGPDRMSAYVATKAGIIGFTRALARELGPRRIRVNTVSPGWIMTDRQLKEYVDAKVKKMIKKVQCIPELIQPEEIAEVVLFLASDASRAITGQEILADRGWCYS